ncbi:hypothetical protein AB0M80_35130 [Amycolatopsis sp. NPDC051045]|uniref:hypothetical protein n=1 Tax=Amycolatopsis sp. NPDC051045 TaxID=3156922 RepID=UPI0034157447
MIDYQPRRPDTGLRDSPYQELEGYAVLCDNRADGTAEHAGPDGECLMFTARTF